MYKDINTAANNNSTRVINALTWTNGTRLWQLIEVEVALGIKMLGIRQMVCCGELRVLCTCCSWTFRVKFNMYVNVIFFFVLWYLQNAYFSINVNFNSTEPDGSTVFDSVFPYCMYRSFRLLSKHNRWPTSPPDRNHGYCSVSGRVIRVK